MFETLIVTCQCFDGASGIVCICPQEERALRAYSHQGPDSTLPPMSETQRHWCLDEIGQVEGFERQEYEKAADHQLARGVLDAWVSYCRDKGLL